MNRLGLYIAVRVLSRASLRSYCHLARPGRIISQTLFPNHPHKRGLQLTQTTCRFFLLCYINGWGVILQPCAVGSRTLLLGVSNPASHTHRLPIGSDSHLICLQRPGIFSGRILLLEFTYCACNTSILRGRNCIYNIASLVFDYYLHNRYSL